MPDASSPADPSLDRAEPEQIAGQTTAPSKVPPHAWVSSTYFAEGYPYTIVNNLPEILFKDLGASLGTIGLTSLFHLPWNLKFLWGPFLDRFETKRTWLVLMEAACSLILVGLAFVADDVELLALTSAAFLVLGTLAATNDIAIDGYYMEGLDEAGQSQFVGYRAMAYRVATLLVKGGMVSLVGIVGWSFGFVAMAAVLMLVTLLHLFFLPRVEVRVRTFVDLVRHAFRRRVLLVGAGLAALVWAGRHFGVADAWRAAFERVTDAIPALASISLSGWIAMALLAVLLGTLVALPTLKRRMERSDSYYSRAFVDFLSQPAVGRILAFVILFRTGESFLQKMKWPFLKDEMGMTKVEYGLANGTIGVVVSIAATLIGGMLISKHGLKRWVWPFILAQNTLNLLYAVLGFLPDFHPSTAFLTGVIALEEAGAGLGTAVFMVYLMRCCDPAHKAAHFAILTALMSLSFTFAGVLSGFVAERLGFGLYFAFTFLATFPMMALLFVVPRLDH